MSGARLTAALPCSLQVIVCSTSLRVGEWCKSYRSTAWLTTSHCLFNVPQSGWVVHILQQHGLAHYKSLFVQRPSEWVSGGSLRAALPGSLRVIVCATSLRVGEWYTSYSSTAWLTTSHCLFNVPKSGWVVHVLQQHCLAHYKSLFVQRPSEWVSGASLTGALPGSLRVIVCATSLRVGEWCTSYSSTAWLTTSHCLFNVPQSGWVVHVLQQHGLAHYKSLFVQRPSEWVSVACLTALPGSLQVIVCSTSLRVGEWCMSYSTAWLATSHCLFNVPKSGWVVHVLQQHCLAYYKSLFVQRPSEWVSGASLTAALPGSLQVIVSSTSLRVGEWCTSYSSTAWLTTSHCLFNVPQSGWVVHVLQQHCLAHYKSLFVQRPSEWVSGASLTAALPGSLQVIVCSTSLRVGELCTSYSSMAWLTTSHCLFNIPQSGWVVHVLQHCLAHYKSLFVQHPSEWVSGACLTAARPGSLQVIVCSTSLRVGEWCMSYSTAWLATSHCLFNVPQCGWVVHGLAHYKSVFVQRPSEWVSGACLTAARPGSLQVIVCSTSLRVGEWCISYSSTAWLTTSHYLFNVPQSGWVVQVLQQHGLAHYKSLFVQHPSEWVSGAYLTCSTAWLTTSHYLFNVPRSGWVVEVLEQHCLAHYKSLFVQRPSEWVSGASLTAALPGSLRVIVCSTSLRVGEWCTSYSSTALLTTSHCLFNVPQSGWVVQVLQEHCLAHYESLFVQRPSEWVSGASLTGALPGSLRVIVCSTSLRVGEWCTSYSTARLTTSHCLFNIPQSGWVVHVLQHCLARYKSLFVQRPSVWVSGARPSSLQVSVCSTSLRVGEWCMSYSSTAWLTTSHYLFNVPRSGWVVEVLEQHCLAHYKSLFVQRPSEWVSGASLTAALPGSLRVIVCSTSLRVGEWCTSYSSTALLTTSHCLFNVPQSGWVVQVLQEHCLAHYESLFVQRPSEWVSGARLTALPGSLQVIVCSTSLRVGEWCKSYSSTAWLTASHCSTSLRVGEWCTSYSTARLTTSHCLLNVPQSGCVVHVLQHCLSRYKSLFVQRPSV